MADEDFDYLQRRVEKLEDVLKEEREKRQELEVKLNALAWALKYYALDFGEYRYPKTQKLVLEIIDEGDRGARDPQF